MFNVRFFTILSFIVMLFVLIGSVSATDLNDTGILSVGDDEVVSVESDLEKLSADSSTFSALSDEIGSGGNVTLTHDYYSYDGRGSTIYINTADSVIDGKGAVIDMAGSSIRPFYVTAAGVTFKNLTIKNSDGYEAIYFNKVGTVTDCNFVNNSASASGGAVYFSDSANGTVLNCNFTGNTAYGSGGAIFMDSGSVLNCNFTGNTAVYGNGGAIYMGSGNVSNCNFVNNTAKSNSFGGGAVYFTGSGTVSNCNFVNNIASSRSGGAVYFKSDGEVTGCNFVNNSASATGGALYFKDSANGTVLNCNFINNAANEGGAIYGSANFLNCNFTSNTASSGNGGAVYFNSSGTVLNSNFINNTASNLGGAIYGSGNLSYCSFVNNSANDGIYGGGAIYMESATVENCNFTGNTAVKGGAIYFVNYGTLTNCSFTGNTVYDEGGAIYIGSCSLLNCNFTGNKASGKGGAIYLIDEGNVTNCSFTGNTASDIGGAVYFISSSTVKNSNFVNNTVMSSNSGGALYFYREGTVLNCNFTGNTASSGGAIYFYREGTVLSSNFTGNKASGNGGAIYFDTKNGAVENCNFTDNTASNGGAVYFLSSGSVLNSTFTNNKATGDFRSGGAVFFNSSGTVLNCNFTNNKGTAYYSYGGAIYFLDTGGVTNCNFINNYARYEGGAVYFLSSGTVSNCNFTGNTADYMGGAIYFDKRGGAVLNCNFTGNTASDIGGAIYIYAGTVSNCNFTGNTANFGGAFYSTGEVTVSNCKFVSNDASSANGGAINIGSSSSVSNCNFTGNTANNGGAVHASSECSISNCNFVNNTASVEGGAITISTGTVSDCNFDSNTVSSGNGGAIKFFSKSHVTNCNFTNNKASLYGGAVYYTSDYWGANKVTNSNFYGNNASSGSAIYSHPSSKSLSIKDSSLFNNRADCKEFFITESGGVAYIVFIGGNNLLNAIYSEGDVTFDNVNYWGSYGNMNTGTNSITRSNREQGQNITITINNTGIIKEYTGVTERNGQITLNFILIAGNYNITAYHPGDTYYTGTEVKSVSFTTGIATVLNLTVDNSTVTAKVTSDATGNVTFNITNVDGIVKTSTVNLSDSIAELDLSDLSPGKYSVTAVYNGDKNYRPSLNTTSFELKKLDSIIIIETADITITQNEVINITVNNKKDNNVTVFVNGKTYIVNNGVLNLTGLDAGVYLVVAFYAGDDNYDATSNATSFEVVKYGSAIGIDVESVYEVGEDIVITLTPVNSTGAVSVTINGKPYNVVDNKVTIAGGLENSTYYVVAKLAEDNKYYASESNATFYVNKVTPFISADNLTFTVGSEGILDIYGPSDRNAILLVSVNGMYLVSILSNGSAKLDVSSLNVGSYKVDITYFENDKYADKIFTDVATVSVNESSVVVSVDSGVRYYRYAEKFNATITDNGVGVPNMTVMFTINGVTYTKTTDDDGVASIAINLSPGNYTVGVEVPDYKFNDNVTLEVKHTIYAEDLVKFFRNGTQYYALFLDSNGNPLVNTDVIFNINGVFYYRTTNTSGVARLNINLMAGDYIITAYNTVTGEQWSNNIKVLPTLYGDDLTKKYGTTTPYSVKLVDGTGKAMANETITLNINGVFYNRTTDSDGVARLNINLMAGEYIITASYKGVNWSNKVTVTQ